MAIQTPLHVKGLSFPRQWHLIDPTVTGFATNANMNVNAVIEVNEVGRIVDARPSNRTILPKARADGFQRRAVCPNLLVAVHAHLCRRNPGKGRRLDRGMAVAAVDSQSRHVMLVAERHRLIANDLLFGDVRRADNAAPRERHGNDYDKAAEDRETR